MENQTSKFIAFANDKSIYDQYRLVFMAAASPLDFHSWARKNKVAPNRLDHIQMSEMVHNEDDEPDGKHAFADDFISACETVLSTAWPGVQHSLGQALQDQLSLVLIHEMSGWSKIGSAMAAKIAWPAAFDIQLRSCKLQSEKRAVGLRSVLAKRLCASYAQRSGYPGSMSYLEKSEDMEALRRLLEGAARLFDGAGVADPLPKKHLEKMSELLFSPSSVAAHSKGLPAQALLAAAESLMALGMDAPALIRAAPAPGETLAEACARRMERIPKGAFRDAMQAKIDACNIQQSISGEPNAWDIAQLSEAQREAIWKLFARIEKARPGTSRSPFLLKLLRKPFENKSLQGVCGKEFFS